jgi:hypothetical protein
MVSNERSVGHRALILLALLLTLSVVGCKKPGPEPGPEPDGPMPPPPPAQDASPGDAASPPAPDAGAPQTACQRACDTLRRLHCPGASGSPNGTPCEVVCEHTESGGVTRFCPEQVATIRSCAELSEAFSACER